MSSCKWGCGTGFNSMVEREEHEKNCKKVPSIVRFLGSTMGIVRTLHGRRYRFTPTPLVCDEAPLWQQCAMHIWLDGYGWDEIVHPTAKRQLLEVFKNVT